MPVSDRDTMIFARNLAVMVKSGIPLLEGVRSQASQAENPAFKRVLAGVARSVESGQRFSAALERFPSVFRPFFINVVKAGETSGSLEANLDYIASQIEASVAFKKALTSALMYPAVLLCALVVAGFAMAYFVLPTVSDLLSSFSSNPPFATRAVLFVSSMVQHYALIIILGAVAVVALLGMLIQRPGGKAALDAFALHLPVIGRVFRGAALVEFARIFSTLLKSGVPVHQSLVVTGDSLGNAVFRRAVHRMVPPVLKGNPISPFLDRKLFTPLFIEMMEVGEKSARIEQNLEFVATFYQREVEHSLKNMLTLLEPVLLIIVGVAVLLLALAILGPLYQVVGTG